jgi:hypothetical protein
MLFNVVIASENHTKPINANYTALQIVEVPGMYTYQWGLKAKGSRPAVFKWAKFA